MEGRWDLRGMRLWVGWARRWVALCWRGEVWCRRPLLCELEDSDMVGADGGASSRRVTVDVCGDSEGDEGVLRDVMVWCILVSTMNMLNKI